MEACLPCHMCVPVSVPVPVPCACVPVRVQVRFLVMGKQLILYLIILLIQCLYQPSMQVRFLVMGNIFCTKLPIQLRFDLKGCTKGRTVGPAAAKVGPPPARPEQECPVKGLGHTGCGCGFCYNEPGKPAAWRQAAQGHPCTSKSCVLCVLCCTPAAAGLQLWACAEGP